jgi:hypothetical protein
MNQSRNTNLLVNKIVTSKSNLSHSPADKSAYSDPEETSHDMYSMLLSSVPDPNPDQDPLDPRVFWPPGSGSTSQKYGSGSGSFYHHAKIIRKTLNPTILRLFLTFYL